MGKNEKPCSTETVSHQVIEQQILTALDDRAKVALVIDESDLCLLIDALSWRMADLNASPRSRQWVFLQDLMKLKQAAFGAPESK